MELRVALSLCLLVISASCSSAEGENSSSNQTGPQIRDPARSQVETVASHDGSKFLVQRALAEGVTLPQNSDLKMVDGDLTEYGRALCRLDSEYDPTPERCEVFVQGDPKGALIGYAVLRETDEGVELNTSLETNTSKGKPANGCWITGTIYQTGSGYEKPVAKLGRPFEGQIMYSAWEKSPGDFMVATVDANSPTDDDPNAAMGVWYLHRTAKKLRIEQERWNYCYNNVIVDEVFDLALSFARQS